MQCSTMEAIILIVGKTLHSTGSSSFNQISIITMYVVGSKLFIVILDYNSIIIIIIIITDPY